MKRTRLIAALLFALLLSGCGGSSAEYKTDVATSELADKIDAATGLESMVAMEDSYLLNAMQIDVESFEEYTVKINSRGINIDEYGIFKAPDDDSVDEVKKIAEDYLKFREDNWMSEYMPEEFPKLENAQVKVCGRYVMYAILDESMRETAFTELENALKN